MDNAMVKRGIGAVVLAIIAALLLGYLLKDKSRERQEVVDMKLPGAPEMNIPNLTGSSNEPETSQAASLINESTDAVTEKIKAGTADVVATASGAASTLKDAASDTVNSVTGSVNNAANSVSPGPGFAIRPPLKNEQRETVDVATADKPKAMNDTSSRTLIKAEDSVVASTEEKPKAKAKHKTFKPRLVEEKKKPAKKAAKVAKPQKQAKKPKVAKKEKVAAVTNSTAKGKYSIQILATSSQSRASKLAKTMKGEGYSVFITQTQTENKVLYRVRVGAHANRDAAVKAQEGMKRRYQKNFFVQNSLVVSN